jgi:hypothetical protein
MSPSHQDDQEKAERDGGRIADVEPARVSKGDGRDGGQ